jgi:uncharacterized membrane protein YgaE (UPF0421/DUF939 family)
LGVVVMINVMTVVTQQKIDVLVKEQMLGLLIGLLVATAVNMTLHPAYQEQLKQIRDLIEKLLSQDLIRISEYLILKTSVTTIESYDRILDNIQRGIDILYKIKDNQLFYTSIVRKKDTVIPFHLYFTLLHHLYIMNEHTKDVTDGVPQRKSVAKIIRLIAYVQNNPNRISKSSIRRVQNLFSMLKEHYNHSPLPHTRKEFIVRSALYDIFIETERYFKTLTQIHGKNTKKVDKMEKF